MIRTQIYLPEEQIEFLKLLASKQGTTFSEQIRRSVEAAHPSKENVSSYAQKLLKLKTDWFDYDEYKKLRQELRKRPTL